MKIALVQSMIGIVGGQDKALFSLYPKLIQEGHDVDVITFSKPLVQTPFKPIIRIPLKIKGFGIYQKLMAFSNTKQYDKYDLVISMTGSICNTEKPLIYYDQNSLFNLDLINLPKYQHGLWKLYYKPYAKFMRKQLQKIRESNNIHFVSNSNYSKSMLAEKTGKKIDVIYPPVRLDEFYCRVNKRYDVLMVSRISPEKNLHFAIDVLNKTGLQSAIFGNTISTMKAYAKDLKKSVKPNVHLLQNQERKQLRNILAKSKIFFHAGKETFGIAVVEGIASGCLPVVPDNSGNKETVPIEELRYDPDNTDDAIRILRKAYSGKFDHYLPELQDHIKQFDESVFAQQFSEIIKQKETILA